MVLVVDDDPHVLEMSRVVLETYGYEALVASESATAEALFESNVGEIRAVISELRVSGESGYALVNRLIVGEPSLPVLFVHSGTGPGGELPAATRASYLAKPFSASELIEAVRHTIDSTASM